MLLQEKIELRQESPLEKKKKATQSTITTKQVGHRRILKIFSLVL